MISIKQMQLSYSCIYPNIANQTKSHTMSTTFGIKIQDEIIPVAYHHNIGNGNTQIDILNPLVLALPNNTEVIAIDNTAQGINCVGDIKMIYNLQSNPNVSYIKIVEI